MTHIHHVSHTLECLIHESFIHVPFTCLDMRLSHFHTHFIYEWVMWHIRMCYVTHMNESCPTFIRVMSHIWMNHVTHMNDSYMKIHISYTLGCNSVLQCVAFQKSFRHLLHCYTLIHTSLIHTCATWRIHLYDMTRVHHTNHSLECFIQISFTYLNMRLPHSYVFLTRFIHSHMCNMTYLCVWHDYITPVTLQNDGVRASKGGARLSNLHSHSAHSATQCNTVQHTATHWVREWVQLRLGPTLSHTPCNTLQHTATHCSISNTLQYTATHCNTLQHTATLKRETLSSLSRSNSLQHTATHCNTLQHTAIHCNTLQHTTAHSSTRQQTTTHCSTILHTATQYNTLQHTATPCNTLQHTAAHCNTLQHTATHCNTLQHTTPATHSVKERQWISNPNSTAAHCNTLQHTATHCNTLQHTAAHHSCNKLVNERKWISNPNSQQISSPHVADLLSIFLDIHCKFSFIISDSLWIVLDIHYEFSSIFIANFPS